MSIECDWYCQSCGVHRVADFEQHKCWRCGSDDISVEQLVTVQRLAGRPKLLAEVELHWCMLDVSDVLRKAGTIGKTTVTPLNIGVTREMARTRGAGARRAHDFGGSTEDRRRSSTWRSKAESLLAASSTVRTVTQTNSDSVRVAARIYHEGESLTCSRWSGRAGAPIAVTCRGTGMA